MPLLIWLKSITTCQAIQLNRNLLWLKVLLLFYCMALFLKLYCRNPPFFQHEQAVL